MNNYAYTLPVTHIKHTTHHEFTHTSLFPHKITQHTPTYHSHTLHTPTHCTLPHTHTNTHTHTHTTLSHSKPLRARPLQQRADAGVVGIQKVSQLDQGPDIQTRHKEPQIVQVTWDE